MAPADPTPLARVMREEGRYQTWLADQVGVDKSLVNRWIHGLHVPDDKRVLIARALGREVQELWPEVAA